MEINKVIEIVRDLQDELVDVDGISREYGLGVLTNGDDWLVDFCGIPLVTSEDFYDDELIGTEELPEKEGLRELIIKELKDVRGYLILVLAKLEE